MEHVRTFAHAPCIIQMHTAQRSELASNNRACTCVNICPLQCTAPERPVDAPHTLQKTDRSRVPFRRTMSSSSRPRRLPSARHASSTLITRLRARLVTMTPPPPSEANGGPHDPSEPVQPDPVATLQTSISGSTPQRNPLRRRRLPSRPPRSPRRSPQLRAVADDDDIDLIALDAATLPSRTSRDARTSPEIRAKAADAGDAAALEFGFDFDRLPLDSAPPKKEVPPLPPARSSVSIDIAPNPTTDVSPRRSFNEYLGEVGPVRACLQVVWDFLRHNYGILIFLLVLAIGLALLGILSPAFRNLKWKGWVAFAIVSVLLSLLVTNALPTEISMLLGLTAMLLFKIITPVKALTGFANEGVAAVAVLFVVAEGVQRTSVL
eukprot:IDg9101t1